MKKFNFKTLTMRILASFIAIIVLISAFIVYSFVKNSEMEKNAEELVNKQLVMVMANQKVAASVTVRAAASTNFIVTGEKSYLDIFKSYTDIAEENNALLLELDSASEEERKKVSQEATEWRESIQREVFDVQQEGNEKLAIENLKRLNDEATVVRKKYDALATENADEIAALGTTVIDTTSTAKVTGLVIGLVIVLLGIAVAIVSARSISRPIKEISDRMDVLSKGDLSEADMQTNRKDEIGSLVRATNAMTGQLRNILASIHDVSSTVASNSEELSQSAIEVKEGSGQIAHTMQELSDGMETQTNRTNELADTVSVFKDNVSSVTEAGSVLERNSANVNSLTATGKELMQKSSEQMQTIDTIMQQSVGKVEGLQKQSQEITQLVQVIKEIANQTNLLALNAAIEAARAGEHGKGFSVVADEVRKLAEQVQLSIGDISSIVERIQQETTNVTSSLHEGYKEVNRGTAQINETNETFDEISSAVNEMENNITRISTTISEFDENTTAINTTIQELASLSEEVTAAIYETTATVEQTASIIEEMANSNEQLAQSAEHLNYEVNHFKL